MKLLCTRPSCPRPQNNFPDLDRPSNLKTTQQKYCTSCGMPLILAGRYLPKKLLGQGGFGAAFLACDRYTPTMRNCVVKQFQPSGNLTSQQLEIAQNLFEREALVLEQLGDKHPQIPDLYAFFPLIVPGYSPTNNDEQYFYLVQEFIDGQDLETELNQRGAFSEKEVLEVLQSMLNVLKFVHEKGSIHRDIKPSNIMRDPSGRLYLLDFGAVKQVASGAANNPQPGSTGIYSLGFAPPEQMAGSQVYPATDLYALAATCLNLLTGKPMEDLYNSYNNCWQWRQFVPKISNNFAATLDRMLLLSPSERFASAQEVLSSLSSPPTSIQVSQTPPPPSPPPPVSPPKKAKIASFSLLEILASAAFTGFEAALLFIALSSLFPSSGIIGGLWGASLGGLIFAQYRRLIEKIDLLIIAGISFVLVWFIPPLHRILSIFNLPLSLLIVFAVLAAAATVAIATIFRLVYGLLSKIFSSN